MKAVVDQAVCLGFGYCCVEAPRSFVLAANKSTAQPEGFEADGPERLRAAARRCPTGAITLYADDGEIIAP